MNTTENTLVENTNYVDESVSVEKVDGRHNNKGRNPKDYSVHNNNKLYLDGYLASLSSVSMPQYRVDVYPYLFGLGQKALHNTTIDDVEKFFAILGENEKKQTSAKIHVVSLYRWARKNVEGFKPKLHRSVVEWLAD